MMEYIGIKELSQQTSACVSRKDWIVVTKNGKPVKLMIDIDADDLEDFILAKHFRIENELRHATKDLQKGRLKTLQQMTDAGPKKRAA